MAPGGSTSNLFTYFVDGNVALSITMSFLSTVCAVFMIPLLWFIYISQFSEQGATVPYKELMQVALLILLPVIIGALIRFFSRHHRCGFSMRYNKCMCCCDKRARFGEAKGRGGDNFNSPTPKITPTTDANDDSAVLKPFPLAQTEKHDDLGSVNVITPQGAVPGSVVQFITPFGTRGQTTVPWGFSAGDKFVVNMTDPADPRVKDFCFCYIWQWISTIGGIVGVLFLIATIYVGVRDNRQIFTGQIWGIHVVALAFQPLGCLCGFFLGLVFWCFERNLSCCRCACGSKNAQRLDCRDLRAISIETGVQNTPLMITTVGLAFSGCNREEALIFILTASLYYVVNSFWYVLVLRCIFSKWCDKTFADDEARCCENLKYLCCGDCPCCLKRTFVQREADAVEASFLSVYSGTDFKTSDGTACLPIRLSKAGPAAAEPATIIEFFEQIFKRNKGDLPALRTEFPTPQFSGNEATEQSMPVEQWRTWTYQEYYDDIKITARALLSLGLERHASVNIWGFNSPQWLMSQMGAIFAGGKAAGIYPTDTTEQVLYKIQHSNGQIVVIEDQKKLHKLVEIGKRLETVKAIVCWGFSPTPEDKASVPAAVLSWEEFFARGVPSAGTELEGLLQERIADQKPGHCCALIYTSGTTGAPKAVMMSHDNIVFTANQACEALMPNFADGETQERVLSYLPLSHVAGMLTDTILPLAVTANTDRHITVHFARNYDLSKGTLAHRLRAVQPTAFLGVPRVWEKVEAKIKKLAKDRRKKRCCCIDCLASILNCIAQWAKGRGAKRSQNLMLGGNGAYPFCHCLADKLILSKVKAQLGLSKCTSCITGAAPISTETLQYFGSLGINIMELYGMSESSGITTWSSTACHMWGTCGYALPGYEVKILKKNENGSCEECPRPSNVADAYTEEGERKYQGEICFRGRHIMMGYLCNPKLGMDHVDAIQEKLDSAIDDEGWLHSGDKGIMTTAGMVKITGRYKELLIGAGGENVAPVPIENAVKLAGQDFISNVMMFGDRKPFLAAMITLKAKGATGYVRGTDTLDCVFPGTTVTTIAEAMNDKTVIAQVQAAIKKGNEVAPNNASTIKKFTILPYDFSVEGEELTSTLKLKRSVALQHFQEVAGRVYTQPGREAYVPCKLIATKPSTLTKDIITEL